VKIIVEDLWKHPGIPGMIIVTTNATVKANGALVMGRGAALQAKTKIPGIDLKCGAIINEIGFKYGFQIVNDPTDEKVGFGMFQVKYSFNEKADLDLIANSCVDLGLYLRYNPKISVRMNFPGIGFGQLPYPAVYNILVKYLDELEITICTDKRYP
jgi:hypothetical protein